MLRVVFLDMDSSFCVGWQGEGGQGTTVDFSGRSLAHRKLKLDSQQQAVEMKASLIPLSRANRFPVLSG